jgi:hypothetical protein
MRVARLRRNHPILCAAGLFILLGLALCAAAGEYLALHQGVGGWTGAPPAMVGRASTFAGTNVPLYRTSEGFRFGQHNDPGAVEIATVSYAIAVTRGASGWPEPTTQEWNVSAGIVKAAPGAPGPSDHRAWVAMVVDAFSHLYPPSAGFSDPPRGSLRGEAIASGWSIGSLLRNPVRRLWHAPLWLGTCIVVPALIAGFFGRGWWIRRSLPGRCHACGYDLAGLVLDRCPECGAKVAQA